MEEIPSPCCPPLPSFGPNPLTAATAGRGGEEGGLPHGFEHGLPEVREPQNQLEVDPAGFHNCEGEKGEGTPFLGLTSRL